MKINIEKTLELFDVINEKYRGHIAPIIGMLGEDLNAAAFKDYMEKNYLYNVEIDNSSKFQAIGYKRGSGPKLDRWIYIKKHSKKILYQCEIKSFCAYAINGYNCPINKEEMLLFSQRRLNTLLNWEFRNGLEPGKTSKVMVKMETPEIYKGIKTEPLLILWWPVTNRNNTDPFFSIKTSDLGIKFKTPFKKLHIFSVSLYFRQLLKNRKKFIKIDAPEMNIRTKILKKIIN